MSVSCACEKTHRPSTPVTELKFNRTEPIGRGSLFTFCAFVLYFFRFLLLFNRYKCVEYLEIEWNKNRVNGTHSHTHAAAARRALTTSAERNKMCGLSKPKIERRARKDSHTCRCSRTVAQTATLRSWKQSTIAIYCIWLIYAFRTIPLPHWAQNETNCAVEWKLCVT